MNPSDRVGPRFAGDDSSEDLVGPRSARDLRAADRLIVALDVEGEAEALALLDRLGDAVRAVKVGKQLFTAAGPGLVRKLASARRSVFLDLKFHDIPHTVAAAIRETVRLRATYVDVHASGGKEMMRQAARAAAEEAARLSVPPPRVLGVTVLTSLDDAALREVGVSAPVEEQVVRLALLAREAGLDGVVASPREIGAIRKAVGPDFLIVTPGIRAAGGRSRDDQKRTLPAADAIAAGASYLVVGRPITQAADPAAAARGIVAEIAAAAGTT